MRNQKGTGKVFKWVRPDSIFRQKTGTVVWLWDCIVNIGLEQGKLICGCAVIQIEVKRTDNEGRSVGTEG